MANVSDVIAFDLMPVCETITLLGAFSAAISGPEIVKSIVGGLIGDGTGTAAKHLSQSLYSFATGAQNANTLAAMHDCFVGSIRAMVEASDSVVGSAEDDLAQEALGNFSDWMGFEDLSTEDAERLVLMLDRQVRAIFGQQGRDVRISATDQVITVVEQSMGYALTPALRAIFHEGRGDIGGWAFEFETRFSKKVEAKEVFNVLVVDRLNELTAGMTRIENKQDHVLAAIQRQTMAIERQKVEHFVDAWKNGTLTSEERDIVGKLMAAGTASGAGTSQVQIAVAAVTVQTLAASNDPARRDVAELAKAGAGREAAAQLATVIDARRTGQNIDNAEAYREAARLAVPFSVADAIMYFSKAADLDPSDFWTLIELSRLYQRANSLSKAMEAADQALPKASTPRERSVSMNEIGDILVARNDLAGALAAYEEGLTIRRTLAEGDPSSAHAQRDVSVSLDRIGNILVARNDLAGALAAYEEGLTIARTLAKGDPSSAHAQRDVSVSLNKVGNILVARNDLAGALAAYEEGLTIARTLGEGDPSSAHAQRDLFVSLWRMAEASAPTYRWEAVKAQWDSMRARGMVMPADEHWTAEIDRQLKDEGQ
ncbi:MAG: tetratricopeptide repeat protein [Sphingobium sp.]